MAQTPLPPFRLVRSKRKTLALQITPELELVVRCPQRMPQAQADAFVREHLGWIQRHLERLEPQQQARLAFDFSAGQQLPVLGIPRTIRQGPAALGQDFLCLPPGLNSTEQRRQAAEALLRGLAKPYLMERTAHWAAVTGLCPLSVKITGARTRWGSCSSKGAICYSYRLICLPARCIDYVVVHELAHLAQHNHSPRFYSLVGQFLPDYRQRQEALAAFPRLPF